MDSSAVFSGIYAALGFVGWGLLLVLLPFTLLAGTAGALAAIDAALSRAPGNRWPRSEPRLRGVSVNTGPLAAIPLPRQVIEARRRELEGLEKGLSDEDWLNVLQLLRDGVSREGIFNLMRLRRTSGARRRSLACQAEKSAQLRPTRRAPRGRVEFN